MQTSGLSIEAPCLFLCEQFKFSKILAIFEFDLKRYFQIQIVILTKRKKKQFENPRAEKNSIVGSKLRVHSCDFFFFFLKRILWVLGLNASRDWVYLNTSYIINSNLLKLNTWEIFILFEKYALVCNVKLRNQCFGSNISS